MNWRRWAALAGAGAVLVSGLGLLAHRAMPVASQPAFVDPCGPAGPGASRTVSALPVPVRVPGKLGPVMSATMTESTILLDVLEPEGPRPQWLVGLDPRTLATQWRWRFPAEPGPISAAVGFGDPWVAVAGGVALAMTGIGGPDARPRLHALDLRTGKPRWTRGFPDGTWPVAEYVDNCVVVVNDVSDDLGVNGTLGLWGIDPATGRVLWQDGPAKELLCTDPARPWLYAGSDGHLLRYSLANGEVTAVRSPVDPCALVQVADGRMIDRGTGRWYKVDWSRPEITPVGPAPVRIPSDSYPEFNVVGDVLVVDDKGKATVCDRRSGAVLWQDDGTGQGYFIAASGQPNDRLFFRKHSPFTASKRTVSLSAVDARTGRTLWHSAQMQGNDEYPIVDPRSGAVLVHVTTTRRTSSGQEETIRSHLYALDSTDGHTLWDIKGDWFGVAGPWLLVQDDGALRGFRMS